MRKKIVIGAAAAALAVGIAGASVAVAASGGEATVAGPEADAAKRAALAATGGGTANEVERDSEDGATWEVEVTKPDGKTVDVRLDQNYNLVVIEPDAESGKDGSDSGDDGGNGVGAGDD